MRRAAAALAVLAAGALAGAAAQDGAGRPPVRVVATSAGRGHLPAYAGPALPPLGEAPASTASPAPAGSGTADSGTPDPGTTTTAPPTTTPPPDALVALGVTESEDPTYRTVLSRASVPAGEVTVELANAGGDPHNLTILRRDADAPVVAFPDVAPGEAETRRVRLAPGTYRLFCTLPEHDARGMHATLVVTAG